MAIELTYGKQGNPIVWVTWAQRENGLMELRSISLTKKHAGYAKKAVEHEMNHPALITPILKVWTEECEAEHVYGGTITQEWLANAKMVKPR